MTDTGTMHAGKAWGNRIVGTGEEPPDQLLANPFNWRIHPKSQQDALSGALDQIGWVQQVVVNKRTGHVVDGHLRVTLAMRRDERTVPVLYVDLSEDEERLALATLDPISAMASADNEKLAELLSQVTTENAALRELLDELSGKDDVYSRKIESPVYVPSGVKPVVSELFNDVKTKVLVREIENAETLTPEERLFLVIAAQRHTVLNFAKIADYYASSDPVVRRLMEDSALVIIDFDRAIDLGFVQLTKAIATQVADEYGE